MTATALAVRPPIHAAAPPAPDMAAHDMGIADHALERLPASLLSVPALQRKCASCEGENNERSEVQPKLEVGPVDDPYEREADDIAGRVMAMREPSPASAAPASVQRQCVACGDNDNTRVRRRLEVGPVEDPHEREADDVAGQVMASREVVRRRETDEPRDLVSRAPASVQRKCAACGGHDDEMPVRPLRAPAHAQRLTMDDLPTDPLRDDTNMPRMRSADGADAEHIAASAVDLTSGGAVLSRHTRNFFEGRMGHDLSNVRVHSGSASDAYNDSIGARAFTFKNHVWLGRSETESANFTMAHELAHVIQQTQPAGAPTRGRGAEPANVRRAPKAKMPVVKFAGKPYWTSKTLSAKSKNSGTKIHEDLLEQFQKTHSDLFFEAPVPRSLPGKQARSGEADLYKGRDANGAERTVGVNFKTGNVPTNVSFDKAQPYHQPTYSHSQSARPRIRGLKKLLIGVDEAPKRIWLGELKPIGILKGFGQLSSYEASYRRTRDKANKLATEQHGNPAAPAPQWPDIDFERLSVSTPNLTGLNGASFGRHPLEVRQLAGLKLDDKFAKGNLIHTPPTTVYGELKVRLERDGVYYYYWEPDPRLVASSTPPDLLRLWPLTDKLFTALRTNRQVVLPLRRKPSRAEPALGRAPATAHEVVRRRKSGNAQPFQNHFDKKFEGEWVKYQKQVKAGFKEPEGTDVLTNNYLIEIDNSMPAGASQGIEAKQKAANSQDYQRVHQYRTIRLIASPFAPAMAKLRRLFGSVFAKGSELYEKIKAKFDGRSKPSKSLSGGGILGALLRAAFKVLLLVGRQIVASTMIQLTEQMKGCMVRMFESWFSTNETVEAIQEKVEAVKGDLEQRVEAFVGGDPETLAETLFGPYGKHVDTVREYIENITSVAGPILTAYNVVKWGIQALACASPPLIGCLWGLARSAIEWAAGKVIETCWFMKKVTPKILKIEKIRNFMRDSSQFLANGILDAAGGLLPEPVGSFLKSCKTEPPTVGMPSAESVCEEGGGAGGMGNDPQPSKEAMAFWDRWEKLSFEKQMALKRMLGRDAAKGAAKADWDKMNAMLDWAEKTSVDEIKRLAEAAEKGDTSAIPGAVAKVKEAAGSGGTAKGKTAGEAGTTPDAPPATGPGGGKGADDSNGPPVLSTHPSKNKLDNPSSGPSNGIVSFSADPAKLKEGAELKASLTMATTFADGTIYYSVRDVPIVFVSYDASTTPKNVRFYIKVPEGEQHYGITVKQTGTLINLAAGPGAKRNYEFGD